MNDYSACHLSLTLGEETFNLPCSLTLTQDQMMFIPDESDTHDLRVAFTDLTVVASTKDPSLTQVSHQTCLFLKFTPSKPFAQTMSELFGAVPIQDEEVTAIVRHKSIQEIFKEVFQAFNRAS